MYFDCTIMHVQLVTVLSYESSSISKKKYAEPVTVDTSPVHCSETYMYKEKIYRR